VTAAAPSRARRWLVDRGGLFALAVGAIYFATASPYVVDGDSSEFVTLGAVGGVAHPPGYPAYLLWLRLWSWLPASSPAHRAALATALLGALGAWALHAACRAWGARPLAAVLAAGVYAVGPAILRIATAAEVFALNQLVGALVIWLAARAGPLRGGWRVAALGVVAGIGLADHSTCVMMAPVGLLGAVRGVREASRGALAAAGGVAALALGLGCYAYLWIAPDNTASWGPVDSFARLVHHVLREDYGGPGAFAPHAGSIDVGSNELALARTIGRGLLWAPAIVGCAWFVVAAARRTRADAAEPRVAWVLLALCFVLAGPVLASKFDVPPSDLGLYVVRRFHCLSLVPLVPAIAVGVDAIAVAVAARARTPLPTGGAVALVVAGLVAAAAWSLPELAAVHSPANETGIANVLHSLPPNAVLLQTESEPHFGIAYLQLARDDRRDVTEICWPLTAYPWYRDRLAANGLALPREGDGEGVASVRTAAAVLASGRPLFIDQFQANIAQHFPVYPYGIVFRVLPAGAPAPSIAEVFAINRRVFDAYELGYELPGADDEFATRMHERYASTWQQIGDALAASGDKLDAAIAYDFARRLGPQ
jgi:hypothetical protein